MTAAAALYITSPITDPASPFARLCQASYLLGKVQEHQRHHSAPFDGNSDSLIELDRNIRELSGLLHEEVMATGNAARLATPMALCFSARLSLYDQ